MTEQFVTFVKSAWKAVVALAVPILVGALAAILDGFGDWLADQPYAWVGIGVGLINSIAVYLKRNVA